MVRTEMVRTDEKQDGARAPASDWPAEALSRSQGFSVESPIGTLGTVEAVRFSGHPRRPVALVVRVGGPESRTTVLVPVPSIESVVSEAGRILLRPGILLRRSEDPAPARDARAVIGDRQITGMRRPRPRNGAPCPWPDFPR